MYAVNMKCEYDVVIVSAGGYPKDINLYQAQKALTNASQICAKNGTILLLAECIEKIGNIIFEEYIQQFSDPVDVIKDFTVSPFQLGRHKAFLIAKVLENHHIAIYSSINPEIIEKLLLYPVHDPELFIKGIAKPKTKIAFIPEGEITIPKCHE
jgi:nickel-dependent lactate racemase